MHKQERCLVPNLYQTLRETLLPLGQTSMERVFYPQIIRHEYLYNVLNVRETVKLQI
jgi:hypothetical protein